jgi:sarcosine oxidase
MSCHRRLMPSADGAAVNRRFPGYRLPADHACLYQPDAGFVLPERAIVVHVEAAQALGAEIRGHEPVLRWDALPGGGVRVTTARGTYEAGHLVLSPGAWVGELAPPLAGLAVPERQVLGWFQPRHPGWFGPDAFPVANIDFAEGRYYLLPTWGVPGLKIGRYNHLGERVAPDALNREVTPATVSGWPGAGSRPWPSARRGGCATRPPRS